MTDILRINFHNQVQESITSSTFWSGFVTYHVKQICCKKELFITKVPLVRIAKKMSLHTSQVAHQVEPILVSVV